MPVFHLILEEHLYEDITDVICVSGLHELPEVCIMLLRLSFVCRCSTVLLSVCRLTKYKKKYCIHGAVQHANVTAFGLCALIEVQHLRILCSRDQPYLSALVIRRQKHTQFGPLAKAYLAFPLMETETVSETLCS